MGVTPDGIQVDKKNGHIYWSLMGLMWSKNDGFLERSDLEGGNVTHIIPKGNVVTPKQISLDHDGLKADQLGYNQFEALLSRSDREGRRVMRSNTDGTSIETLVQTGSGFHDEVNSTRHCVGITLDIPRGLVYWTQKGPSNGDKGRIMRAPLALRPGETPSTRTDIETLFSSLPEPIDLDIDFGHKVLYWTDRGDGPDGNSLNSASVGGDASSVGPKKILQTGIVQAIGLALDLKRGVAYVTELYGNHIYKVSLDGRGEKTMVVDAGSGLTGIVFVYDEEWF